MNSRRTGNGRLETKLTRTVVFLVTVIFVCLFTLLSAEMFFRNRGREIENQQYLAAQSAARIESLQSTIENIASLIVFNDVIQKGIYGNTASSGSELYAARKISDTLKEYLHIIEGTDEITLYTIDGRVLTSREIRGNQDPGTAAWFREFKERGVASGFSQVHDSVPMQDGRVVKVISYITDYYSIRDYHKKLGELIISVEYQSLLDMLRMDSPLLQGYALCSGDLSELINQGLTGLSPADVIQRAQDGIYNSSRGVFIVSDVMKDGWILLSEISESKLLKQSLLTVLPLFAGFVLLLTLMNIFLRRLIRKVVDPVNELSRAAGMVGHGDFSVSVDIHTDDEIEELASAFNRMVVDINDLMRKSVEHEKRIQQMQTENLLMQINPHFIYNTMNSIVYMARMHHDPQIADFTNAFISLLQSTLQIRTSVFTTLGKELKIVQTYLFLQEYRYTNKFTYEILCPEELKDCRILSVMLQPVVENAIFHGIAPKEGEGHIRISARRMQPDSLCLVVEDDGVGISDDSIREILREDYQQKNGVHKIGLGNVYARIREIYHEPNTLTIISRPGEGTKVTITVPYETVEKENEDEQI